MRIEPINNNYNNTSFKKLIISSGAKNIINNLPKKELNEFNKIAERLNKTKFWDLEINALGSTELFYDYFLTKGSKRAYMYTAGVMPFKAECKSLYVLGCDPFRGSADDSYDELKFPTEKRVQEIWNNFINHLNNDYGKEKKKEYSLIKDFADRAKFVEIMDESYQYMEEAGYPKPLKTFVKIDPSSTEDIGKDYYYRSPKSKGHDSEHGFGCGGRCEEESNSAVRSQPVSKFGEKITFNDVGGQDEAISILKKKILYPIKYPEAFKNRMLSHGMILYGKPGTGKSLIALALSNEAGASFIKINASDLTSKYHGESEKNWRDVFDKARKSQPSIIFIDEFDTVAQSRGHNKTNNYDDTVLNQILAEMSDVEKNGDKVFIIGATNRFLEIDEAAKRSGRFGTHIEIKPPETTEGVLQIFDIHIANKKLDDDIDREKIAKMLLNKQASGADIAAVINSAMENTFLRKGIYERMDNGTFKDSDISELSISMQDFTDAIDSLNK